VEGEHLRTGHLLHGAIAPGPARRPNPARARPDDVLPGGDLTCLRVHHRFTAGEDRARRTHLRLDERAAQRRDIARVHRFSYSGNRAVSTAPHEQYWAPNRSEHVSAWMT